MSVQAKQYINLPMIKRHSVNKQLIPRHYSLSPHYDLINNYIND